MRVISQVAEIIIFVLGFQKEAVAVSCLEEIGNRPRTGICAEVSQSLILIAVGYRGTVRAYLRSFRSFRSHWSH